MIGLARFQIGIDLRLEPADGRVDQNEIDDDDHDADHDIGNSLRQVIRFSSLPAAGYTRQPFIDKSNPDNDPEELRVDGQLWV